MLGCAPVRVETSRGDVVLLSSLAMHFGRRARAGGQCTRLELCAAFHLRAGGRLCEVDRGRKGVALGPDPDPHTGLHRANTTTHPPEGLRLKPRFGFGRNRPLHGVAEGITAPPQWLLRDETTPRLTGAQPHVRIG
jgi:hypothetical protein